MSKGTKKIIVFVILVLAIFLLARHFGWASYFTQEGGYAAIQEMVHTHFWKAALLYIAFTVVACVLLALPGVTFAIIAGAIFGPWWGTLLCAVAATIGAVISFLVGRFFLKDGLRDKVAGNKYIAKLLFDESTKNEMLVLMITRLVPLFPYNLQNFAYGITDISLSKYTIGSFLFMIPGTAMYTIGTYALTNSENRWLYIGLTVVLVIIVTLVSRKLKSKYVSEDENGDEGNE